jgi:succinoglycan biosynthesis transport protein ExoP
MKTGNSFAPYVAVTPAGEDEPSLDIRQILASLQRRRVLFASVFAALAALITLVVLTTPPSYTAVASVLVDERAPDLLKSNADGRPDNSALDTGRVDTQVEILRSRTFADDVVDQLGLEKDPEFNASLRKPGLMSRIKALFASHKAPANDAAADRIDRHGAPDVLLQHMKVNRVGVTYLLNIAGAANTAVKAKQIANAFANEYLSSQVDTKAVANKTLNDSLESRLTALRGQVQTAETAVQQYKIEHNLLSTQGETLTEQEVSTLDQQLAMARAQQAEAEARAQQARSQLARGSTGEDVGEALSSPVIQQLRQQRALASQKVAVLSARYGEKLPIMLSARKDLADVDTQIHDEIDRIISNLDAQARIARQRTESIASSVSGSRGNLVSNSRSSVGLNELQRNLDSLRTLYETLLNRYKETNTEQGLEQPEAHIVTAAQTPASPSAPKKGLGIALALMVGLVAATVAVVLAEALDATVSTADKLSRLIGLPCLASLPTLRSTFTRPRLGPVDPLDYLVSEPRSSFAEAFRNLRTSLVSAGMGRSSCVLAITSALPQEGKSTTAKCLGRTFALSGASVVVVDCDLSSRHVRRDDTIRPAQTAMVELVWGDRELENALLRDESSGAWLLPLSAASARQVDMLSSEAIGGLVANLRARFDLVILDCASVLAASDTRALAARADAVVLLVRWRRTPMKAVQAALALLASAHAPVVGAALSFVDLKQQARTGYGDPEYYFKAYQAQHR